MAYIVMEINQARHQPRVIDDEPYDRREDAEEVAQSWRDQLIASASGRRERYEVWECNPIEDED